MFILAGSCNMSQGPLRQRHEAACQSTKPHSECIRLVIDGFDRRLKVTFRLIEMLPNHCAVSKRSIRTAFTVMYSVASSERVEDGR